MAKLYNLARMTTATTGTGTITLESAVSGYLAFDRAGVANGDTISYGIRDGAHSEIGTGVYSSSGTTLTRKVTKSTNVNAAINLSGTAEIFITPRAEDLQIASPITASLGADVAMTSAYTDFTGPGVAQGSAGTWFASATVVADDAKNTNTSYFAKLWDGTTVIASARVGTNSIGAPAVVAIALSGFLASPAGNLRISLQSSSNTAKILANTSGFGKDSIITAFRIA